MATVNLGRIKPVFRGAFNNSTAYVIDDIVTSGNETFIAIAATQGNATSDASKWTKLAAKGADGADGTDVAATLANKEISFKTNAGALDGIPIGTAGQFLKVNSGATGYEYGDVSSDVVKVHHTTTTSATTELVVADCFSNTYKYYQINLALKTGDSGADISFRWLSGSGSGTQHNNNNYVGGLGGGEFVSSGQNFDQALNSQGTDSARLTGAGNNLGNLATPNNYQLLTTIKTYNPHSSNRAKIFGQSVYTGQSESNTRYMVQIFGYEYRTSDSTNMTGFKLMSSTGNGIAIGTAVSVYGFKE
jgi:hypothetical protein